MIRDLPRGTVTFVFTDIAGSTKLLEELGEERYAEALEAHRDVLRAATAQHDGVEIDTQGDAFFLVFPTASKAIGATTTAFAGLRNGPIRIRVGIHTGTAAITTEGYVGMDVHRGSRIASAGHGGQVLLSAATAALLEGETYELADLGEYRLKDLPRVERIYQLGRGTFPPIRSFSPSNIPSPTTAFLGREEEFRTVSSLLADEDVRLLTITGPGGIGKTRLALELARASADVFRDGRWWVPLGPLSDPRFAVPALASVIAREEASELSSEGLAARLGSGSALILFDNAEHLLPDLSDELSSLVSGAAGATFLVTSRAPLHLEAEHEYQLPPMDREDAASFLLSRARATGTDLERSPALTSLCDRLDRLPLALQLAAPRLKLQSVEELTNTLSRVLDLPGPRDMDPRHRTLRATIEWSHSLLSPDEQAVFRRLSVFADSASIEAAEEIAGADTATLFDLLDRNLIRRRDGVEGSRFWMLETIRGFARERLETAGEAHEIRREHARFYRGLAARADIALEGRRGDWPEVLDEELDNLRRSMTWYLDEGDMEGAQEIAGSLGVYWMDRGLLAEMRSWLERALEGDGPRGEAYARALSRLSSACYLQGDYERAAATADEALTAARSLGGAGVIQLALTNLANALDAQGASDRAWALEEEALQIARKVRADRPRVLLVALINMGYNAILRGEFEDARGYLAEAISLAVEMEEAADEAAARCNLAIASLYLDRIDEAAGLAAEAIESAISISDRMLGSECLVVLAAVAVEHGRHPLAAQILGCIKVTDDLLGYELQPVERALNERTLARVREALEPDAFTNGWDIGMALDVEDAYSLIAADRERAPGA